MEGGGDITGRASRVNRRAARDGVPPPRNFNVDMNLGGARTTLDGTPLPSVALCRRVWTTMYRRLWELCSTLIQIREPTIRKPDLVGRASGCRFGSPASSI